nr:hypothetical protein BSM_11410 [uncultured archaeon]
MDGHSRIFQRNLYTPKFYRRVRGERRGIRKNERGLKRSCLKLCALGDFRVDKSLLFRLCHRYVCRYVCISKFGNSTTET